MGTLAACPAGHAFVRVCAEAVDGNDRVGGVAEALCGRLAFGGVAEVGCFPERRRSVCPSQEHLLHVAERLVLVGNGLHPDSHPVEHPLKLVQRPHVGRCHRLHHRIVSQCQDRHQNPSSTLQHIVRSRRGRSGRWSGRSRVWMGGGWGR